MAAEIAETEIATLRARLDRMTRLATAQTALSEAGLDLDAFMQAIVEHLAELTGAKGAIVELVDGGDLVYRAATDRVLIGTRLKRDNSFSGLCVATAEVLVCADAFADDRVDREACVQVGVGSMICAPLMHAAEALGVLKVFSEHKAAFADEDIEILRVLASMLGAQMSRQLEFQHRERLLAEKTQALECAAWEAQQRAAQEELFETAFHDAPIGMALGDLDGRIVKVNGVFCDIIGYSPEEARTLDFRAVTHPDDLESSQSYMSQLLGGEIKRHQAEKRYIRKDGSVIRVQLSVSLARGEDGRPKHFIGQIQDLTDQRAIENRYRLMAENATDIIVTTDMQGLATFVSPACEAVTGYAPEDILGRSSLPITHPDDVEPVRDAFGRLIAGQPIDRVRWRVRHKRTGEWTWLESNPVLIRDEISGAPTGYLDVLRDVTAQKAQEDALAQARLDAEAATRSKAEFLANMSHELRTPLNSIIGFTRLLTESRGLTAEDQRRVELVHGAGQALHAVIDNVLDFSKLEAAALELHAAPFDLAEMLRQAVAMLEPQAAAKDLRLRAMIDADAPASVVGDAGRLRQVLLNLLSNAVKFTARGGVTASLTRVGGDAAAPRLRVEIIDTGVGIAEAKQAGIFNRFVQAGSSVSAHYGGTGLGLAISHQLISLMGGEIGVESRPGAGSTFWFELALPAAGSRSGAQAAPAAQPPRLSGRRILVVDDVELNRELMLALLSKYGCEVGLAEDGAQAIEALRAGAFELVLMDCQMPVMDGFAATQTIRASGEAFADIPIVALTASAQPEHLARCQAAGMNAHLTKPLNPGALEAVLETVFRAAPAPASAEPERDAGEEARRYLVESMGAAAVRSLLAILVAQMENRFAQTDARTVREDAHALAGSSGMMGFLELSRTCQALEAAIDAGDDHQAALDLTRGLVSRTIGVARRWEVELAAVAVAPPRRQMLH
ncbi:PAS domain S-box protein [Caulobacter segnis]|uniref:PAS domain S-box protein n=1 Tax=Caulobacter segnis TaxID=88688 RepID=UPI001CBAA43B|nr:PAS domain S-box protein [Caulobacter segnis]UAL11154.1 PAS domain S-box protein [Caulobacter segnis]